MRMPLCGADANPAGHSNRNPILSLHSTVVPYRRSLLLPFRVSRWLRDHLCHAGTVTDTELVFHPDTGHSLNWATRHRGRCERHMLSLAFRPGGDDLL